MTELTVWALIVPTEGPARWERTPGDLGNYQALVGGYVEAVDIEDAVIFCNEDGRVHFGDQPNQLLAQILSAHDTAGEGHVLIHGPAVIVGKPRNGWETSAPASYGAHDGETLRT